MIMVICMRNIPTKNYWIYFSICCVTLGLLLLFINKVNTMGLTKKSILSGSLYEITEESALLNLKSYAIDNPSFFLYISNHSSTAFELEFQKYIVNTDLQDNIVYLNGWNKLDTEFVKKFQNELFDSSLNNISYLYLKQSNLYFFKDGKVIDILYQERKNIVIEDVKKFIESIGEKNND